MAPVTPDLRKIKVEQGWRGKRGKGGGYGVFPPVAVLVVERARPEQHWPGLFIGRPCRFPRRDISRPPSSPDACACAYSARLVRHSAGLPTRVVKRARAHPWRYGGYVRHHVSRELL